MEFLTTPEFWVAVSFFIFLGALFYFGVHKKIATLLDARAAQIAGTVDQVRQEQVHSARTALTVRTSVEPSRLTTSSP